MKTTLLLVGLFLSTFLQAQNVINGSFETNTAPLGCTYNVSNAVYDGYISNSAGFGVYEALDIIVNGCFVNNIPDGSYAVTVANNPTNNIEGEAVSLEIDAPLTIGNQYQISFQATAVQYASVIQGDLLIGVSTASNSFGDLVDTAVTVENVWNSYSFTFTATSPATHITVMPIPGISSWNCVDDFSIIETCASTSSTETISACESYTWIDGVTYTNSNNSATDTLVNAAGCDSIVTLDLTINPLPNTNILQSGATLTADQFANGYQWLNCDDNNSMINGETNQTYTPTVTGNYSVEVTLNGCIDTSVCVLVDYTGINELTNNKKELVQIIDFMGRETEFKPNTPLIFIYSDGTRKRVMKLEE
jgi:hypothetical protein